MKVTSVRKPDVGLVVMFSPEDIENPKPEDITSAMYEDLGGNHWPLTQPQVVEIIETATTEAEALAIAHRKDTE